jgi:regulator of replication initiation timing
MDDLFEIVSLLDNKLSKLLGQYKDLQQYNSRLIEQNNELKQKGHHHQEQFDELEKKYESLRVANAMVGSKEDKHITKLKINTLIREIDKCIVQLSD